ncbi:SusC/RagA family TonB-linked outer membrane protein [uncultured Eudoraea sp.]|uniref:SusC/RagA family TonB-linked outer membrane protein n=1 Tax=uncultured Eudoraea sp. TaxID=1035614 RepID=UPI00263737F7|nr:SusC/RagA family TonB-linked outer membrane protein [uncultured Eudoraea sp.]
MKKTQINMVFLWLFLALPFLAFSQATVRGSIQDELDGTPLPGVAVVVKGTNKGTTTDFDGNYEITVDSFPATLVFSSLGFETREIRITDASTLNVTLAESATGLDEVVITGLATSVKRENLANAVSTVSSQELVGTTSQSTVDGALYGKVPGVNITSSSGAPGGGFALRLRGISSINGNNQPLIIVDGVYYNNVEIPSGLRFASGANRGNEENSSNRLADLDPNDIQNIEVLKGSSAAAIYGQRGNAGVIIITTKRGKTGKTKISFSQDVGSNTIANPLGIRPWTAASVESTFDASERAKFDATIASNGKLYDFEDIIYGETGFITETRLNATGGNDKTKFYVGGAYRDEDGIIKNTGFDRLSLRMNIEHKISDVFDFAATTNYTKSNSSRSFTGNENEGGLSYGYTLAFTRPWNNLFPDANGNYPNNPNYPGNPIFVRDNARNKDSNNRIVQGLTLNTKILTTDVNRVKLVLAGGLDYLANETYVYVPETHQAQIGGQGGFVAVGKNNFTQYNAQAIGVWDHDAMQGDLGLTTQLGLTYLNQNANLVNSRGSLLAAGQTSVDQSVNQVIDQNRTEEEDFGFFAQVEGNYRDQIIATLGFRWDKSSRNGDQNKFYGFPKASLAVNLMNFDFWNVEDMSQLKLRVAYGETGNPAGFGSTFTSFGANNIGGNIGQSVLAAKGDPDVEPETAQEFEVGFDMGFLQNRISFEATYYNKKVKDLILTRALPSSSGFTQETTNLADLRNQGVELGVRGDAIDHTNIRWNTGIIFYLNRSKITRLDVPAFPQPGAGFGLGLGTFFIEEGQPVTQLVGTIDGVQTQVGNVEPDFQMAFTNNFTLFKQLDVLFLLQWKQGGENLNLSKFLTDLGGTTPDLETAEGQARLGTPANALRFVEPAGYVRLREAAIYYRLPTKAVSKAFGDVVEGVKFGFSGRNIFTITDYSSYDPEVSVNGGAGLSSGIEVTPFPSSRQFYFHLNVNF